MRLAMSSAVALAISLAGLAGAHAQPSPSTSEAAGDFHHRGSGITLPARIGDMRRGEQRDLSNGGEFDLIVQYGSNTEPATLYIYRSAYPNPALWYERTRRAMNANIAAGAGDAWPRGFALGSGSQNGLREEIELPEGSRFRSTAVAIAQVGQWMVKARITSPRLDKAGIAARMDALLGGLSLPASESPTHPLRLPSACSESLPLDGSPIRGDRESEIASATALGAIEFAQARGSGGLAADPSSWCRSSGPLDQHGSTYRQRDGSAWVVLLGDSGTAISGRSLASTGRDGAAIFASTPAWTRIANVYDSLPSPEQAVEPAVPVLVGQERGLAEINVRAD